MGELGGNHRLKFLMSLIVLVDDHTLLTVIIEGTARMKFLVTVITGNGLCVRMDFHHVLHFLSKMNTKTMNDTIALGQGLKIAIIHRTAEFLLFLLQVRMFGSHMKIQGLLL